jgi:hypothetical protein
MPSGQARQDPDLIEDGRRAARHAIEELALRHGAAALTRPPHPGARSTIRSVEPLAGLRAAREIEFGTRHAISNYIRDARETGQSWHDIGTAMHLVPGRDASLEGDTPPKQPSPTRPHDRAPNQAGGSTGRCPGRAAPVRSRSSTTTRYHKVRITGLMPT